MKFFRTRYLIFCAGLITVFSSIGAVQAETLSSAVEAALLYHPSVESAKAEQDVAAQKKHEERSGYFPELSVSSTGGRIFGDNSTSRGLSVTRGDGYSYLWDGSLTAKQMIFDGFETTSRIESALEKQKAADMSLLDIREQLALRAAQSYVDVLRARTGLAMLRDHEKKVLDYLGRIKTMVDEGAADDAEYQQARDVRVILSGFVTDYEGQVRAAEAAYMEVTGHLPDGEMHKPDPRPDIIPENVAAALEYSKGNHPMLKAAAFQSRSTERDIEAEKASLYPDVDGELSYLKSDKDDIIGGELIDAKAVVRMNWNFETGGGQLARIRQKKHQHQNAMARLNELERQIERDLRLAYSEFQTALEQMDNQEQRRTLNHKLFETYKLQFDVARITLLQLMQADNQLFNTKLEKMNGEHRVLAAQYAVLASMGRLQEAVMGAPLSHEQK